MTIADTPLPIADLQRIVMMCDGSGSARRALSGVDFDPHPRTRASFVFQFFDLSPTPAALDNVQHTAAGEAHRNIHRLDISSLKRAL